MNIPIDQVGLSKPHHEKHSIPSRTAPPGEIPVDYSCSIRARLPAPQSSAFTAGAVENPQPTTCRDD